MPELLVLEEIEPTMRDLVGGKALSLAEMNRAGWPVPAAFILTTEFQSWTTELRSQVTQAWQQLKATAVAVRSSATKEDGTTFSFAGQQETFLNVRTEAELFSSIDKCIASLHSERAVAYRRQQNVDDTGLRMAVIVQVMVAADTAGVLFTQNPQDTSGETLLIEAGWGLGDTVVSGRITPDRWILQRQSGGIVAAHLGQKTVMLTPAGEVAVPDDQQQRFCLNETQLHQLHELGQRLESQVGEPRDIEWAFAKDRLYVLQSRPITTANHDLETIRQEWIETLSDTPPTVWVRYNLSESLPEPTPMTWAVVSRMLAQDGGMGELNRALGAKPDPALGSLGAFDLIAGRPMANLARMPRLQFTNPPWEYPLEKYRQQPELALNPQPVLNPMRDGWKSWLRLPITIWRIWKMSSATRQMIDTFPARWNEASQAFRQKLDETADKDFKPISSDNLLALFEDIWQSTTVDFAQVSLQATVFADHAWISLENLLANRMGATLAKAAVARLAAEAEVPPEVSLKQALEQLQTGQLRQDEFLKNFGHRGPNEMELAQPRWREEPSQLPKAELSESNDSTRWASLQNSINRIGPTAAATSAWSAIAQEAKLSGPLVSQGEKLSKQLQQFVGYREMSKHTLILGFALLRRILLELDLRHELDTGIFFLTPDELPALIGGQNFQELIQQRRRRRQLELQLYLPSVLFSDTLSDIGQSPIIAKDTEHWSGNAVSPGYIPGTAWVLSEYTTMAPPPDAILVCPSTDPAWVPLFAKVKGLVMESGGILSHGAIVAREFGLPAVAGIPQILQQLQTGDRIIVDGNTGTVSRVSISQTE